MVEREGREARGAEKNVLLNKINLIKGRKLVKKIAVLDFRLLTLVGDWNFQVGTIWRLIEVHERRLKGAKGDSYSNLLEQ